MRISLNQTHSGPPAHHLKMMKTTLSNNPPERPPQGSRIKKPEEPAAGLDPMPEASQKVADG